MLNLKEMSQYVPRLRNLAADQLDLLKAAVYQVGMRCSTYSGLFGHRVDVEMDIRKFIMLADLDTVLAWAEVQATSKELVHPSDLGCPPVGSTHEWAMPGWAEVR